MDALLLVFFWIVGSGIYRSGIDQEFQKNCFVETGVSLGLAVWKMAAENVHTESKWRMKKAESLYSCGMGIVLDHVAPFLWKPWEE